MTKKAWKCLVIDEMHPDLFPVLKQNGIETDYQPHIAPSVVGEALAGIQILVVRSKVKVNRELLRHAPDLKLVARAGAGVDNIDEEALREKGITMVNAPEGNRDAVGEHTIGMLLCLLNHLHTADRQVRDKVWKREANRGTELGGKTVGIIGFGNMGQAFAKRLSGFGCTIMAYDKYHADFSNAFASCCTMEQIWQQADIVSVHVPLTPGTYHLINQNWIQKFRKEIILINTSRGEVADTAALVANLKSKKLKGLALDVLENEKLNQLTKEQEQAFDYLASQPNVVFSPHVAGWSHESYARISLVLGTKILEYCNNSL